MQYKNLSTGQSESLNGRFEWVQYGPQLELSLLDPLGQTAALLVTGVRDESREGENEGARTSTLKLRNGKSLSGESAEDLTEQALGWRLPMRGLSYWLDGKAAPGSDVRLESDSSGTDPVSTLFQDGWSIRYPVRAADVLPRRLDLSYPGPIAEVRIRIVIDTRKPEPVAAGTPHAADGATP